MDWLHPPRTRNDRVIRQGPISREIAMPYANPFLFPLPPIQISREIYSISFKFNLTIDRRGSKIALAIFVVR